MVAYDNHLLQRTQCKNDKTFADDDNITAYDNKKEVENLARTSIPWWVFIALGIIVTVVSYILDRRDGKFLFFILVGIAFLIYGMSKYALNKITKKEKIIVKHVEKRQLQYHQEQKMHASQFRQQDTPEPKKAPTYYCPNCKDIIERSDNFCSSCGLRLR